MAASRITQLSGVPAFGDDAPPASAPLSTGAKLFWTLSLTTVGYMFWGAMQTPRSRKRKARA